MPINFSEKRRGVKDQAGKLVYTSTFEWLCRCQLESKGSLAVSWSK